MPAAAFQSQVKGRMCCTCAYEDIEKTKGTHLWFLFVKLLKVDGKSICKCGKPYGGEHQTLYITNLLKIMIVGGFKGLIEEFVLAFTDKQPTKNWRRPWPK